MTVTHQKTTAVTNQDATPRVANTAGKGAGSRLVVVSASIVPTGSQSIDSTIQVFRVPFSAVVKSVELKSVAQDTTGQWDVGVYYATDNSNALSKASLLAADAVDADFFGTGAQFDPGGVKAYARFVPGGGFTIINATPAIVDNAAWPASECNTPLWQAVGLTADPGGNADIVLTTVEAPGATTTAISARIDYSV